MGPFLALSSGDSANYVSNAMLNDATLSTNAAQLKIIGVSKDPENNEVGAGYVNWVVTINEHNLKTTTGV